MRFRNAQPLSDFLESIVHITSYDTKVTTMIAAWL